LAQTQVEPGRHTAFRLRVPPARRQGNPWLEVRRSQSSLTDPLQYAG
jgi:hypothetical protein